MWEENQKLKVGVDDPCEADGNALGLGTVQHEVVVRVKPYT
jgi:hypothetical protein